MSDIEEEEPTPVDPFADDCLISSRLSYLRALVVSKFNTCNAFVPTTWSYESNWNSLVMCGQLLWGTSSISLKSMCATEIAAGTMCYPSGSAAFPSKPSCVDDQDILDLISYVSRMSCPSTSYPGYTPKFTVNGTYCSSGGTSVSKAAAGGEFYLQDTIQFFSANKCDVKITSSVSWMVPEASEITYNTKTNTGTSAANYNISMIKVSANTSTTSTRTGVVTYTAASGCDSCTLTVTVTQAVSEIPTKHCGYSPYYFPALTYTYTTPYDINDFYYGARFTALAAWSHGTYSNSNSIKNCSGCDIWRSRWRYKDPGDQYWTWGKWTLISSQGSSYAYAVGDIEKYSNYPYNGYQTPCFLIGGKMQYYSYFPYTDSRGPSTDLGCAGKRVWGLVLYKINPWNTTVGTATGI